MPFQFEGRVRRLSYHLQSVGGAGPVSAELFSAGRRIAAIASGPGAPAVRGWVRYERLGPGAVSHESFDPDDDRGWHLPPR